MKLGDTNVGDLVYFKVSGSKTAFRVMHHGKPDSTYDDSFTGGTILMLDYSESPFSTSSSTSRWISIALSNWFALQQMAAREFRLFRKSR